MLKQIAITHVSRGHDMQDLRWGQEEQSHTNFKLQPGHSQQQKAAQHGSLPPVLTSDKPAKAAAAPAWCSSEVTPGPGYYDTQPSTDVEARPDKPAVAFGATGDGKHGRCRLLTSLCNPQC